MCYDVYMIKVDRCIYGNEMHLVEYLTTREYLPSTLIIKHEKLDLRSIISDNIL